MTLTTRKQKKCRAPGCENTFRPRNSTHKACSVDCAMALAEQRRERAEVRVKREQKRHNRAKLEQLKTKPQLTAEAQKEFNRYIRERDYGKPCISCGAMLDDSDLITGSRMDAGHYLSTGARPELRFDTSNCHAQCVKCNQHLSGNVALYRMRLREVIGDDELARLEGPHHPPKWTRDDLRQIRDHFRAEANKLRKQREQGGTA